MGTRHLTVVVLDKEVKVAQYGQWDGYIEGQGYVVANFIQNKMDLRSFVPAVRKCTFITDQELEARWKEAGADGSGFVNMQVADTFKGMYPQLSRDIGAEVLGLIQKKGGLELKNSIDFAGDSLFCEFAYVLDLDKKNLEIYKGFNKSPLSKKDRFYGFQTSHGYEPIRLVDKIPFDEVSKNKLNELAKSLAEDDSGE